MSAVLRGSRFRVQNGTTRTLSGSPDDCCWDVGLGWIGRAKRKVCGLGYIGLLYARCGLPIVIEATAVLSTTVARATSAQDDNSVEQPGIREKENSYSAWKTTSKSRRLAVVKMMS